MKLKERMSSTGSALLLAAALSFLTALYAPLELFAGSQEDFWFGLWELAGVCGALFVMLFAGLSLIFMLLRLWGKLPLAIGQAVGLSIFTGCYIQGNFLASALPPLDGTEVDWGAYPTQRWLSVGLFVLLFALLLFLLFKFRGIFEKTVLIVSGGLGAILLITLVTLLLTTPIKDKSELLRPTDKGDLTYSTKQNLIVLVTDASDGNEFMAALRDNEEFADTFDDFTYFEDALAGYPFTRNALPLMLTGEWYENECEYEEYVSASFEKSPLMQKLRAEDYRIGLYNDGELVFDATTYDGVFDNQINVDPHFTNIWDGCALIFKMGAIRYAPWDLKYFGYDAAEFSDSIRNLADVPYGDVKKKNSVFYNAISQKDAITLTDEKCARFLHIEGAHVPFIYDKNVNIIEKGTYRSNMEATLTICDTFLKTLKNSGVYDNSAIVILGDHGFNNSGQEGMGYRMHPALLVKGIGEKGEEMQIDSTPLSYEQIAAALTKLTDGAPAADLFPENAYPEGRRFIGYWFSFEHSMEEYLVTGRADEVDKMMPTGKRYILKKGD